MIKKVGQSDIVTPVVKVEQEGVRDQRVPQPPRTPVEEGEALRAQDAQQPANTPPRVRDTGTHSEGHALAQEAMERFRAKEEAKKWAVEGPKKPGEMIINHDPSNKRTR